jgi:SAM-dependent methyltransferase
VRAGTRVLDVGSGPGHVSAAAAARGARPVGLDAAEGMVAAARARHPEIEFLRGDAESLPFDDAAFDAVVAGFLLNHLPHPERALDEMVRVTRAGGRVAITVWDRPERMRLIGVVNEAISRVEGLEDAGLPPGGPDPYRFADDGELARLLTEARLAGVSVETHAFEQRVAGTDELWKGILAGTVRTSTLVERQPEAVRLRIRAALEEAAAPYRSSDGGLALPISAKLGGGRKA